MMSASNHIHSYELGERIIRDWLYDNNGTDVDTYDLKVDIKETVMDWMENYITSSSHYEDQIYEAQELDDTDEQGVWSSIEDALNDWLDEHLFRD